MVPTSPPSGPELTSVALLHDAISDYSIHLDDEQGIWSAF
jgi:hypothetical protein